MIEKFGDDADGRRRLSAALQMQPLLLGDADLANRFAEVGELQTYAGEESLIAQGGTDDDLFLIVSGRVSIVVNGREVAVRASNTHVGEMALVDPSELRSASVFAMEPTLVLKISETNFTAIANDKPVLWRRIALELCSRLRQREKFIRQPNARPVVFVGCAAESLAIARALQLGLRHDDMVVKVWTDQVFGASKYPVESLEEQLALSDFAVLIAMPTDIVASRGTESGAPRDNVVFELGLFMGRLGRKRTLIVQERGAELKIPSDLLGLTPAEYITRDPVDLDTSIAPICEEIRRWVKREGPL